MSVMFIGINTVFYLWSINTMRKFDFKDFESQYLDWIRIQPNIKKKSGSGSDLILKTGSESAVPGFEAAATCVQ